MGIAFSWGAITLLERLLLERLAIAGIARVMQRSASCIQTDVNVKRQNHSSKSGGDEAGKTALKVQMEDSGCS